MKKNQFVKVFAMAVIYIVFSIYSQAFAASVNNLSRIVVEKTDKNTYTVNLLFDAKYERNAFIQQKAPLRYDIYIPETSVTKNTKVVYKKRKDKSNISVSIDEQPFYGEKGSSRYVKLTVDTNDKYVLDILSDTYNASSFNFLTVFSWILKVLAVGIILFAIAVMTRFMKFRKNNIEPNLYSYESIKKNLQSKYSSDTQNNKVTNPVTTNAKKTLEKTADESFSCFDISDGDNKKINYYDYKKAINSNPVMFSKASIKQRQTNPIISDSQGVEMPVSQTVEDKNKYVEPELISVLNITPRIGFYLTNVGEVMALFGFVGDSVFLFKKFSDLSQINLQAKYYDKNGENDLYIVSLDNYRAMIEITPSGMKELAVL